MAVNTGTLFKCVAYFLTARMTLASVASPAIITFAFAFSSQQKSIFNPISLDSNLDNTYDVRVCL